MAEAAAEAQPPPRPVPAPLPASPPPMPPPPALLLLPLLLLRPCQPSPLRREGLRRDGGGGWRRLLVGGSGVLLTEMPRPAKQGQEDRKQVQSVGYGLAMSCLWVGYGLVMHLRQAARTCTGRLQHVPEWKCGHHQAIGGVEGNGHA